MHLETPAPAVQISFSLTLVFWASPFIQSLLVLAKLLGSPTPDPLPLTLAKPISTFPLIFGLLNANKFIFLLQTFVLSSPV